MKFYKGQVRLVDKDNNFSFVGINSSFVYFKEIQIVVNEENSVVYNDKDKVVKR